MTTTRKPTWQETLANLGKVVWGSVLAPISNTVTFFKGIFNKSSYHIEGDNLNGMLERKPSLDQFIPFTVRLGRIGGVILTTLCILGFIGTLAVPIPGIAPIYAFSVAAIAKAFGITALSTIVGRGAGALIGSIIDFSRKGRKKLYSPLKRLEVTLKATIKIGLFGEQMTAFNSIVQIFKSPSPPSTPPRKSTIATPKSSPAMDYPFRGSRRSSRVFKNILDDFMTTPRSDSDASDQSRELMSDRKNTQIEMMTPPAIGNEPHKMRETTSDEELELNSRRSTPASDTTPSSVESDSPRSKRMSTVDEYDSLLPGPQPNHAQMPSNDRYSPYLPVFPEKRHNHQQDFFAPKKEPIPKTDDDNLLDDSDKNHPPLKH